MRLAAKFRWLVLGTLLAFGPAHVAAQSCAMCRANAQATPKEGQRAINHAILVMLFPPLGIMSVGLGFALRYGRWRDRQNERETADESTPVLPERRD